MTTTMLNVPSNRSSFDTYAHFTSNLPSAKQSEAHTTLDFINDLSPKPKISRR